MTAEIIRWGLLIFLLILVVVQLSRIVASLLHIGGILSFLAIDRVSPEIKEGLEKTFDDMRGDDSHDGY